MSRPAIAVVVTYFGRPPLWLQAFLLSCRWNPDVVWLIYGDLDVPYPVPPNVVIEHADLDEINERASDALGTRIVIERSGLRKLCDLKPVHGLMFADGLTEYDWWAYSDLDIVWGNIRTFVTDDILRDHDIVSSRGRKLAGPFTLLRNTNTVNRTFRMIPDLAAAYTDPRCLRLDEKVLTGCLKERLRSGGPDTPRVYWDQELTMSAEYQRLLSDEQNLWWRNGRTFDAEGQELMYLHFHKLKEHMSVFDLDETAEELAIGRRGIRSTPTSASNAAQTAASRAEVGSR
jgi:hypothetical protein